LADKSAVGRRCGECTLCCTYPRIGAPDGADWKKAWVTCKHCLGRKCSIYDERPEPCRQFECLWLADTFIPKKFRPDKVNAFIVESKEGNAFVVHCGEKDKLVLMKGQSRFSKYILALAEANPVVVLTEKGAEPIGAYANRMCVTIA